MPGGSKYTLYLEWLLAFGTLYVGSIRAQIIATYHVVRGV